MRKRIIVKGPVLSRSGYGFQSRFALQALRTREDILDIYIQNIPWGQTGWIWRDDEFRQWIDERIINTINYTQHGGKFDLSLQITIPNEWENMADINVGYTAGIETTKVAPVWLQKGNDMHRIIATSNHSKETYVRTSVKAQNSQTGEVVDYKLETPIEVVTYAAEKCGAVSIQDLELEYDFNFMCMSQWGPRKNLENTIRWWVEEFLRDEVGLIIKTNFANDSLIDHRHTEKILKGMLSSYPDRKCKVYLLHGDYSREQLRWLLSHDKVKSICNIAHGEGFGLPMFEAAQNAIPVITVGWSGQLDFLYHNGKNYFADVEYSLQTIQQEAHWNGVLEPDSQWAFADKHSYQKTCRNVYKNYDKWKLLADDLKTIIFEKHDPDLIHERFVSSVVGDIDFSDESWMKEIEGIINEYE